MKPATSLRSTIVIPARLTSTRLPRKLLLRETGKSVLQHTYESASKARRPSGICVAADCEEIAAEVLAFSGNVKLTDPACVSGTDRVAEIARQFPHAKIKVSSLNGRLLLSGSAPDGLTVDKAMTFAKQFGPDVVNSIQVSAPASVRPTATSDGGATSSCAKSGAVQSSGTP